MHGQSEPYSKREGDVMTKGTGILHEINLRILDECLSKMENERLFIERFWRNEKRGVQRVESNRAIQFLKVRCGN